MNDDSEAWVLKGTRLGVDLGFLRSIMTLGWMGWKVLYILIKWPFTLKFDRATWYFLKFDRRHYSFKIDRKV